MTYRITIGSDVRALLGEGVIWDSRRQKLYWVDIKRAQLFETDPESCKSLAWDLDGDVGGTIGCIAIDKESNGFLAATGRGIVRLRCDDIARSARVELLATPELEIPGNRFNDGGIDPCGGFWAGTMDSAEKVNSGNWWRWDGSKAAKIASGFRVTNGPVFLRNNDQRFTVFLTDSAASTVYKAVYSERSGLGPLNVWARFDPVLGFPDGMCLDGLGRLWIAFWDGSAISAFDPSLTEAGAPIATVTLPVRRPTKLAFSDRGDCFVTSASIGLEPGGSNGAILKLEALQAEVA